MRLCRKRNNGSLIRQFQTQEAHKLDTITVPDPPLSTANQNTQIMKVTLGQILVRGKTKQIFTVLPAPIFVNS